MSYPENGTGPVYTYTVIDPERAMIDWSLKGIDAAEFTIDGGVLTFDESPNYEDPSNADKEYSVTASRLYYENSHFDGSCVASVRPSAIPAKAGIQEHRGLWQLSRSKTMWIPACAGMTGTM